MPVTNYYSVNGVLIGESTGGVRTDYLTDALGSVTATMDQSANIKNTYRYKPYGDLLAKTGIDPDPKFMWNGSTGSRKTGLANSGQYNVNRHYGTEQAAWTSRDPLWPDELAYVYVGGNPTTVSDVDGLQRAGGRPGGTIGSQAAHWWQQQHNRLPVRIPRPISGNWRPSGIKPKPGPRTPKPVGSIDPPDPNYWPSPTGPRPNCPFPGEDPAYNDIPKPGPYEWPRIDSRLHLIDLLWDTEDYCNALYLTKQKYCPGAGKQGVVRSCNEIPDEAECARIKRDIPLWGKCCDARTDELRWRCLPPKIVSTHIIARDGHCRAKEKCQQMYNQYCK